MGESRISKRVVYAVISFACPVLALLALISYQAIMDSFFRQPITPEENAAGVLIMFADLVQLILGSLIGFGGGLLFAVLSFRLQRRIFGVGLIALFFNGLPLAYLIRLWIKGMTDGL